MKCEKCGRETDIIKHIKIQMGFHDRKPQHLFYFNNSTDAMVCIECWNNAPPMHDVIEFEEIRNG
jgi:hypothetical protein